MTPSLYYDRMDAIKDNFERVQKLQMADEMIVEKAFNFAGAFPGTYTVSVKSANKT